MSSKIKTILMVGGAIGLGTIFGSVVTWRVMQNRFASIPPKELYLQADTPEDPLGDPIDVLTMPVAVFTQPELRLHRLTHSISYRAFYRDEHGTHHAITYLGNPIRELKFFSLYSDHIGFTYDTDQHIAGSDVALAIIDIHTRSIREVYRDSFRTSGWEWDSPTTVLVHYGCGTACHYVYKIDVETGKIVDEYHIPIKTPPDAK